MIKNSVKYEDLIKDFESRNIPFDTPGFYDHPNFIQVEEKNASFLCNYAKFVHERPRQEEYDKFVQHSVPIVANTYQQKLIGANAKPDTSIPALISKALEKIGIWNYVVKGSLLIDFPHDSGIDTKHFWSIVESGFTTAHAWVVAPPFYVIDIILNLHNFTEDESDFIPDVIYSEASKIIKPEVEDIISPEACQKVKNHNLPRSEYFAVLSPQTEKFINIFPSRQVIADKIKINYIPVCEFAADLPFEQMRTPNFNGRTGHDIFENEIKQLINSRP